MVCKYCGSKMRLDDKDFRRLTADFYYVCDNCNASCIDYRITLDLNNKYGVSARIDWYREY